MARDKCEIEAQSTEHRAQPVGVYGVELPVPVVLGADRPREPETETAL